ncbi:MAG: cell division protein FtsX [Pseudomonadota bacterium]
MKNFFYNLGYFLKEVKTIIGLNLMSNIFSLLSTGLIFFILAMVVSGWWISSKAVETIKGEAEVSVYFNEGLGEAGVNELVDKISKLQYVREARLVGREEAYGRMEKILGKEAKVLEYFEDNPFSPFIEVKIDIEGMDRIISDLDYMLGIEYVRDNREVLERIGSIANALKILGLLVVTAVGISTMVIISHIIRMGIYENREQINTLRLMGAPDSFISFPFVLEGLLLTLGGGALASAMITILLRYLYLWVSGPLPFIPLPPVGSMVSQIIGLVMSMGFVMGVAGSCFGLASAKNS